MTDRRPILALALLAALAACGEEAGDDGRAASGEVLEGTISDAMLPLDRVRSEAPLEDPEAFVEAQSEAAAGEGRAAPVEGDGDAAESAANEADEGSGAEPAPEPE